MTDAVITDRIIDWLATGEVGASSKCMAMWLWFGRRTREAIYFGGHPHDPDDLNRCLKLLHYVPELRERLTRMAELSPEWAALVDRWDEIEALQMEEIGLDWVKGRSAPKTYDLMREIINSARKEAKV